MNVTQSNDLSIPPSPTVPNKEISFVDFQKVNNNKVDANAFFILSNYNRVLTDAYVNGAVDASTAARVIASMTHLSYLRV